MKRSHRIELAAHKLAVKTFAAEVTKFLDHGAHSSVDISARNYGLQASPEVIAELKKLLPGVRIVSAGFAGYISFGRGVQS